MKKKELLKILELTTKCARNKQASASLIVPPSSSHDLEKSTFINNSNLSTSILNIQKRLVYKFNNRTFLLQALMRRSFILESSGSSSLDGTAHQRLEFIGDRVLELAIARIQFINNPQDHERELNDKLKYCVNNVTLATIASNLELGKYLLIGKGEEINGVRENPKVLADTLEAIIGAIYLDSNENMKRICKFVALHFKDYLRQV
ncbi:hypothetical protein C9374_000473 [Naegleria lovaniensis]|uniref:RNase III domain-containing protein n=1 Tax=Naegleria lovaniensis TaxID=51637 RepID=A0AA88GZ24_NAELO|nr:uncharacterized protein C9374_000473 [Naegleria lovaniensis]KAG2388309.1 hypothetical protein C9374_000473 [Naegleria lovaniensis]